MAINDKTEKITFRCTKKQKKKVQEEAMREGISVSEILQRRVFTIDKKVESVSKDEIASICNMLSLTSKIEDGYETEENVKKLIQEVKKYGSSKICG